MTALEISVELHIHELIYIKSYHAAFVRYAESLK